MQSTAVYSGGILFVVFSTALNATVVYVFIKKKQLQFKDVFMLSMSVGDALQTFLGYTTEIIAIMQRQNPETWMAGLRLCKASGFIVTFLALSSISHLAVLAYDRYLSVCKPFLASRIHESRWMTNLILFLTWLYSFAWSLFPLCSWSSYELESDAARCSINWSSPLLKDKIYIVCLFVGCFFVPIIIMLYSFICVKKEIRQMQGRAANLFGKESATVTDTVKAEKRHTRLALFMCAVFIATWFPYALLSFWAAFFEHVGAVPKFLATAAALIAKSSTVINPIIYSFLHKGFRRSLITSPIGKVICCKNAIQPEETTATQAA